MYHSKSFLGAVIFLTTYGGISLGRDIVNWFCEDCDKKCCPSCPCGCQQ